ncbi:hypothetical protein DMB35_10965 [Acinetobacter baumannii A424]|nr:hypothetical protein DMB35_10965 [Acinetobacter baumannii A424]
MQSFHHSHPCLWHPPVCNCTKRSSVHPLVGGFIGLVIGGMFLLYVQHQDNMVTLYYQCEQCLEHFEIQQSGFA